MKLFFTILLGRLARFATKLKGNNGSAFPGLVVEKFNPDFIKILDKLPKGVVLISGTNGKTTTTKIVTELLESQNLKVFTNPTGSNFVRGVISATLNHISLTGKFNYDIAVLELDEAHAVRFIKLVKPTYSLLLNVSRDQLDRFGEIDHTARLLESVAKSTKNSVIINREDPRLNKIQVKNPVYFGLSKSLASEFPSDDNLLEADKSKTAQEQTAKVILSKIENKTAIFKINDIDHKAEMSLTGLYNFYNSAGALALVLAILPETNPENLLEPLSKITSAFGRGESFMVNNHKIELYLVKNPSAFQSTLSSFVDQNHDYFIAINDNFADGRDVSWLWNVDFTKLPEEIIATSGSRATDMALRLKYDEIKTKFINEDLKSALETSLNSTEKPLRIFATYTAMLEIRKILSGKSIL
jgi:UDP-N-acetylmuramyl tripeptide synthase